MFAALSANDLDTNEVSVNKVKSITEHPDRRLRSCTKRTAKLSVDQRGETAMVCVRLKRKVQNSTQNLLLFV